MTIVSGIYVIRNKKTNKVYIGSSYHIHKRLQSHKNYLKNNNHPNVYLQRAWDKHGSKAFEFKILERVDVSLLLEREQYWIQILDSTNDQKGYNICKSTTAPMLGRKMSAETKAKMAQSQRGRKHSLETRQKIAEGNRGKKLSQEQVEQMSITRKGRKASEETKAKLRIVHANPSAELRYKYGSALRGKKVPQDQLEKRSLARSGDFIVTSPTGEVFQIKGLARFCRENGLDQGSMSKVSLGRQKNHKGWKCERIKM